MNRIEKPMYFADGFVDGLLKKSPDNANGDINDAKNRAANFLRKGGKIFDEIEKVRTANQADPTQTPKGRTVSTYKFGQKKLAELDEEYEKLPDLHGMAENLDNSLEKQMRQTASNSFGKEARQRIASMESKDRMQIVSNAIRSDDTHTAQYVLGAPAFLSGLSEQNHDNLKSQFKNRVFKEEMETIEALQNMAVHLEKGKRALEDVSGRMRGQAKVAGLDKSEKAAELMS